MSSPGGRPSRHNSVGGKACSRTAPHPGVAAGLVAASSLALTVVAPSATAAPPTTTGNTDDTAITVAGKWLEGELTDGLIDAGGFLPTGLHPRHRPRSTRRATSSAWRPSAAPSAA